MENQQEEVQILSSKAFTDTFLYDLYDAINLEDRNIDPLEVINQLIQVGNEIELLRSQIYGDKVFVYNANIAKRIIPDLVFFIDSNYPQSPLFSFYKEIEGNIPKLDPFKNFSEFEKSISNISEILKDYIPESESSKSTRIFSRENLIGVAILVAAFNAIATLIVTPDLNTHLIISTLSAVLYYTQVKYGIIKIY